MNNLAKPLKITIVTIVIIFIMYLIMSFPFIVLNILGDDYNKNFNNDISKHDEAIAKLCSWLNISDIPSAATGISVKSEGHSMNRKYYIQFDSSKDEIRKWVAISPGFKHPFKKSKISATKVEYIILPNKNAEYGNITIDYEQNRVNILISMN